jgi:ketopantoate reductase
LTVIIRLKKGMIPKIKETRQIMVETMREAVTVAEAKGISLPYEKPFAERKYRK